MLCWKANTNTVNLAYYKKWRSVDFKKRHCLCCVGNTQARTHRLPWVN